MSEKKYSKVNAAEIILKKHPEGLSYKNIIKIATDNNMIRLGGKTPDQTLRVDIYQENNRRDKTNRKKRFIVKKGIVTLNNNTKKD